jgi:ABC-2 type transport system permease protein
MTGLMAVYWKELADHLSSKRFLILFVAIYIFGIFAIYLASRNIRDAVQGSDTQFIFLRLFTVTDEEIPINFPLIISFFIPLLSIALGFDAINSERNSGNLSRVLGQPVYRDAVINGKFLASLSIISILIISIFMVVGGMGLRMIGVPPTAEEVLRVFAVIFMSILYGAFWLALSILFSILFGKSGSSLIVPLILWLGLFFLISPIANAIAYAVQPISQDSTIEAVTKYDAIYNNISHISPSTLFGESMQALLVPELSTTSQTMMLISIYTGGMMPTPLPISQSLLVVWPQITSLIGLTALCFAISYIRFMREEVRST